MSITFHTGPFTHSMDPFGPVIPDDIYLFDKELLAITCATRTYQDSHFPAYEYTTQKISESALIRLFVKTLTGQTINIAVPSKDSLVSNIMFEISSKIGSPFNQQRVIFSGRQLDPYRSISDYNIQNGSTLHLVMRLRAGMKHRVNTGGDSVRHGEPVTIRVIIRGRETKVLIQHGLEWQQINAALAQIAKSGNIPDQINLTELQDSPSTFDPRSCFQMVRHSESSVSRLNSAAAQGGGGNVSPIVSSAKPHSEGHLLEKIVQLEAKLEAEVAKRQVSELKLAQIQQKEKLFEARLEAEQLRRQMAEMKLSQSQKPSEE